MEPENEQMNEQTSSFEVPLEKPFENLQTSLKQLFEMVTDEKTQESVRKMVTQKEKEIKERFGTMDTENLGGVFQKFMSANTDESTQEYIRKMMNESSESSVFCEPSEPFENTEPANIFGLKFQSCPMFNKNVPNDISSLVAQKKAINYKIANLTPVEEMEFWAQYHNIPTEQVINKKLDQVLSRLESNKVNNGNGGNEGRIAELEEKIDDIYTEITIIRKHLS